VRANGRKDWKGAARSWSLLFFAVLGAYMLWLMVAAPLVVWIAGRNIGSPVLRLLLGVLMVDLSKAIGLLPAAWLLGRDLDVRPIVGAVGMAVMFFGLEAAVGAGMPQGLWVWSRPPIVLCRLAVLFLLIWAVARLLRWRRRGE